MECSVYLDGEYVGELWQFVGEERVQPGIPLPAVIELRYGDGEVARYERPTINVDAALEEMDI